MNNIFSKLLYLMEKRVDTMLVTIVSHTGSTPRGTGSQMLVDHHGRVLGTIGGGPGEKESETLALQLLGKKQSALHDYALYRNTHEDIGSVCGGNMTVFFQYIAHDDMHWHALAVKLLDCISAKQRGWLLQRLDGGTPMLLGDGGTLLCGQEAAYHSALCREGSILKDGWFSMQLPIGERVIIFGAGHCAQALVPVLASVGFRVTVFDNRIEYAKAECFQQAENVICGDYAHISDFLTLTPKDYVVVMTSGHSHDFEIQEQLLRISLAYIGVIGSRSKTASVNARLQERGISLNAVKSVHTPIGINIKAVTPEEIAISIASEMILIRAEYRELAGELTKACPMH